MLPDACFVADLLDPPYGVGLEYDGFEEVNNDPDAYWAWLKPLVEESLRVLMPGGFFLCCQSQVYQRHLWDWFETVTDARLHIFPLCRRWIPYGKYHHSRIMRAMIPA